VKKAADTFRLFTIANVESRLNYRLDFIINNNLVNELLNSTENNFYVNNSKSDNLDEIEFTMIKTNNSEKFFGKKCSEESKQLLNKNLNKDINSNITWIDGNKTIGLYIFVLKTLKDSDGYIVSGAKLSSDKYVDYIKNVFNYDATIFAENLRTNTSIVKDGKRQIGTLLDPKIAHIVLEKGETYVGKANILNSNYISSYTPILGTDNKPIGALFVGSSLTELNRITYQFIISISLLGVTLLFVAMLVCSSWLKVRFLDPLSILSATINLVSKGNYSIKLPSKKNYDELQELYTSLGKMSEELLLNHEKIESIAYYDSLTGIKNRALLIEKYSNSSVNTASKEKLKCLFYIDIDNLKVVNDFLGHIVGDILIVEVSNILTKIVGSAPDYELFHISGGTFAICRKSNFSIKEIHSFAKEILQAFNEALLIENHKLNASLSIGIAYCTNCDTSFCENCDRNCDKSLYDLLKNAEIALYKVKSEGKNNYKIFDIKMFEDIKNKNEIEKELRFAIQKEELMLYYQPQYNIATDRFRGFEALIRWNRREKGIVSPDDFIPIAEETGLIIPIGNWVLKTACEFIKSVNIQYKKEYVISVNVSAIQLLSNNYVQSVLSILEEVGLNPKYLELEITESILIESLSLVNEKLSYLRDAGISIALDDFGTGYSSLTYLKELPINILKIDKSFVAGICENNESIVGSIVKIGHHMDLVVVAEGVEVKEQLDYLKDFGCNIIQGYYFSKPLSESDALDKIRKIN
jgi:diguanylate cyclase (GGDEF)-like protein